MRMMICCIGCFTTQVILLLRWRNFTHFKTENGCLNPFDTLRFGKIRLFELPNRGMLIRATRCHEFTLQDQVLKCGSAGATLGFQWH